MAEKNSVEKLFDELRVKRQKIVDKLEPIKARRDKLAAQIAPVEAEMRDLQEQMKEFQTDEFVALDKQISQLARALGAKVLVAEKA